MKKKLMISIGAIAAVVLLGFGLFQTNASQASPRLSTDDVRQMVESQYPGAISEIELEKKFNGYVYEVEIKGDGKEYELKIDADTGEILNLKEKFAEKAQIALEDNDVNGEDQGNEAETEQENVQQEEQNQSTNDSKQQSQSTNEKEQNKSDDNKKKSKSKDSKKKQSNDNKNKQSNTLIGPKKAIDLALNAFSGTVKELEFESDDGRLYYEIDIQGSNEKAEIKVHAYSGEIIKIEKERSSNKFGKQAVISAKEAIDIARSKFSGTVKELELDSDDGRLLYEIELKSGSQEAEIEIDAYTGEVLVIEIDND